MPTISYGTFTITNELEGSQFWTTTTAPVSPDYTFTVSNLFGDTNADIKVGDIILYSHYRYTVTAVNNNGTVLTGNRESLKGTDGVNGISPTIKSVHSSHAAIVCEKNGDYNPDTIIFSATSQFENSISDYSGWFVIELSPDGINWVNGYESSVKETSVSYKIPLGVNITKNGLIRTSSDISNAGTIIDSAFVISSDGVITTSTDVGFIIRSIRCSLYSSSAKTELIDQQRVNIAFDGVDGDKGDDGYTVVLTNENHTFSGNTTSAVASNINTGFNVAECNVIVYYGNELIPCQIGTITGKPTGMNTSISGQDTTNAKFTVTVADTMTTQNGTLNIPVIVDSKTFNMKFTYSLKLNGLDSTGLGWKVNYSAFGTPNNGRCFYHGFDETTKQPSSSAEAWILWNGQEIVIPTGCFVNPNNTMPTNTTIYSVYRLPNATTYTGGTFHDVAWVENTNTWVSNTYTGATPTANSGSWTWNEDTDIILSMYKVSGSGNPITNAQLFNPPKKYSELAEPAKGMAKEAEKVAYHYLKVDATGAMIANMTDDSNNQYTPSNISTGKRNILITANDLKIRNGQDVLATYGDSIVLGKIISGHMVITDSNVRVHGKNGLEAISFGSKNNVSTGYAQMTEYLEVSDIGVVGVGVYTGVNLSFKPESIISCYKDGNTSNPITMTILENRNIAYNNTDLVQGNYVEITYTTKDQISYLAVGTSSNDYGANSVSIGYASAASGVNSLAVGYGVNSIGKESFSTGHSNKSYGEHSASFGANNIVKGNRSAAFGIQNNIDASADDCFCAGLSNTLRGANSIAFGNSNQSNGWSSLATGDNNIVSGNGALACGYYNKDNSLNLLCVGNGTDTTKKNAFYVKSNGDTYIAGGLYSGNGTTERKMFKVVQKVYENQTINPSSTKPFDSINIAESGYTPIAVRAVRINNQVDGGNSSFCFAYSWYISGNTFVIGVRNTSTTSTAQIKIVVDVLYIATAAL